MFVQLATPFRRNMQSGLYCAGISLLLVLCTSICRSYADGADYRLGQDDVISIVVYNEPTLTIPQVTIGKAGTIDLPLAGHIQASGRTTRELAAAIHTDLLKWIKDPLVTVSLVQERPQLVVVSGDVQRPDAFDLKRVPRVLDAIAAAGWLKQPVPNSKAYVHRNGKRIEIELQNAIENRNPDANILLEAGDLVTVQAQFVNVYVDGLVRQPGAYTIAVGDGVLQAIARAGGLTTTPDQVSANIRRGGEILPVDLVKASFDPKSNLGLIDGDTVLLNEPKVVRVEVTGEVNKPGPYRLPLESATVLDAITAANGLLPSLKAESAIISILRSAPSGARQTISVDPVALLNNHSVDQNYKLQDGDACVVSEVKQNLVFVSGEVKQPGMYVARDGEDVADLIAQAGGPTDFAALTKVTVRHTDGTSAMADMSEAVTGGIDRTHIALEDGDNVVIPKNMTGVFVMQAVNKPGFYPMFENRPTTVGDVIGFAGGTRDHAKINEVQILRQVNGTVQSRTIDLRRVYNGQMATSLPLADRDVLFVPDGKNPAQNAGILAGIIAGFSNFLALHG